MKNEWILGGQVFKISALQHRLTRESCAFGKRGFVYEYNDKLLSVTIFGQFKIAIKAINEIATDKRTDLKYKIGDEACFLVSNENHLLVKTLLEIPNVASWQTGNVRLTQTLFCK